MHKRAFHCVSGLRHAEVFGFFNQNKVGKDLRHARTFMHVSGLPPPYFDLKNNL